MQLWNKLTLFLVYTYKASPKLFVAGFENSYACCSAVHWYFLHRDERSDYFQHNHIAIQTLLWEVKITLIYGIDLCGYFKG